MQTVGRPACRQRFWCVQGTADACASFARAHNIGFMCWVRALALGAQSGFSPPSTHSLQQPVMEGAANAGWRPLALHRIRPNGCGECQIEVVGLHRAAPGRAKISRGYSAWSLHANQFFEPMTEGGSISGCGKPASRLGFLAIASQPVSEHAREGIARRQSFRQRQQVQ